MSQSEHRYCLCSDPDYCLRHADPEYRKEAIAFRRAHGAPLPRDTEPERGEFGELIGRHGKVRLDLARRLA